MIELLVDGECLIYVMRHGEAEPYRANDATRELTETGREQVRATARWLTQNALPSRGFDMALVSPYQRARQTCEEVACCCSIENFEITDCITPEASPKLAADYVSAILTSHRQQQKPLQHLLLVSHMPMVSYLVDEFCATQSGQLFATAGVAVLKWYPDGPVTLLKQFQGV